MRRTWLADVLFRSTFRSSFVVGALAVLSNCALGSLGALGAGAAGCSSSELAPTPTVDGAAPGDVELEPEVDGAAVTDAGANDGAAGDGGGAPAGDILGTLTSGACGIVKNQITAAQPSLENNVLVFVMGETYAKPSLSTGGQRLFDTPNAGGSSTESEVMSFEVLHYCEGASLLKTETEVSYAPPGDSGNNSITDLLVEIGGNKVGVSVTRAYKPPTQPPMTDLEVKALLEKKLEGIVNSSLRVLPADKWVKQILHVFAVNKAMTDAIGRVWPTLAAAKRADTIVLVTQTAGGGFVYCNNSQSPPLGAECQ